MKRSTIAAFAAMTIYMSVPASAQVASQERAQAYYFEAEAALADGKLDRAEDYLRRTEELLGQSNAKLAALEIKILLRRGRYVEARDAFNRFYAYDPGANLKRDMAPLLVRAEEQIQKEREAQLAREAEARRAAERRLLAAKRLRERPQRLRNAVESCIDAASCAASIAVLDEEEGDDLAEFRKPVLLKQCLEYSVAEACYQALHIPMEQQTNLQVAVQGCELEHPASCKVAGMLLLPDEDGDQVSGKLPFDTKRAVAYMAEGCRLSDYASCNLMAFMHWENSFGIKKNKKFFKAYVLRSCQVTIAQDKGYYSSLMKSKCEKLGFPARGVKKKK